MTRIAFHGRSIALIAACLLSACKSSSTPGLQVTPPRVTLAPSAQQAFLVAAPAVSWRVKEGDVGGSITSAGLYTAPGTAGAYTVVAVEPSSGLRGEASVTVTSSGGGGGGGGGGSGTTSHGLSIPTTHPRLWFTPARIDSARTWWTNHAFTPADDIYMEAAFAHVASNGALSCRTRYSGGSMSAIEFALSNPVVGQDQARWYGEIQIIVYDWCYDELTPSERSALVANINSWATTYMNASWGGGDMYMNNYFWGYLRNALEWGIASYYENTAQAEIFLSDALDTRWVGFKTFTNTHTGGVFEEGSQYGRYVAHYPLISFQTAHLDERSIYDEAMFFREAVFALIYQTTPALTYGRLTTAWGWEVFPFSDDEGWQSGNSAVQRLHGSHPGAYNGDFMQMMADLYPTTNVGRYAQQWLNNVGAGNYLSYWIQPFVGSTRPLAFSGLPLDYYAPGIQYLYARKAWDASSTVVNLQLGLARARGSHRHADAGNWQMWRGGRWVSRETTGYLNTHLAYNSSGSASSEETIAHNAILVNPDSQGCTPGSSCHANGGAALNEVWNGYPVVRRLESQPGYAYANVDLSDTYRSNITSPDHPERDNPAAKHVEREFVFVRDLEALVIFDRIEANAVGGVSAASMKRVFLAHCETNWTLNSGTRATCTNGSQALRLTTLVPASPTQHVTAEGDTVGIYRLEITDSGSAQNYFLHVADATATLSPTVVDNGTSYTLTLDGSHSITFNKGMSSSGGSITRGGNTTPFRSDVQTMTITDSGPAWR